MAVTSEERTEELLETLAKRQESTNRWLEHISKKLGDRALFETIRSGVAWGIIWAIIILILFQTALIVIGLSLVASRLPAFGGRAPAPAAPQVVEQPQQETVSPAILETRRMQLRQWIKEGKIGPVSGSTDQEVAKIEREYLIKHPADEPACFASLLDRFSKIRSDVLDAGVTPFGVR